MTHPKLNPVTLKGNGVILRPASIDDCGPYAIACGSIDTFRYFVTQVPLEASERGMVPFVERLITDQNILGFSVIEEETGKVIGSTSYLDIRPKDFHVEVGMTWYSPEVRGTSVNPACKMLLLAHAFENLGMVRVTLKCDARNIQSANAIKKLGAKPEGVLRKHMKNQFGEHRDTAYFSIIDEEWPEVKVNLQRRLDSLA